ncbi:MAG TPA: MBL fold metallo-hydrolase [Pyrinomonadaceae bacterium]|nr:MBL fold metallo-hydrolase [Pyrinomonadaceae bacterium]
MKIIPIAIPTPFYVGDVNVYLIREDPLTLIDTGPKTSEAESALKSRLKKHGVDFTDLRRIVLTHAHEDHCGLAARIRQLSRIDNSSGSTAGANGIAEIYIHPWERGHLFGRLSNEDQRRLLLRSGVPAKVFDSMRSIYDEISLLTDPLDKDDFLPLDDELELEFETGSIRVIHTPGHTPGSCSLFREADRTMICGDCALKRITPNPILAPDPIDPNRRFPSLAEYLVSLARIRSLKPTLLLTGHGEPITDFEELFNRYRRQIELRQQQILQLIGNGSFCAFDLAAKLFPKSFGQGVHTFLAVSETIAHLDLAAGEGKLEMEIRDSVEYFHRA